MTSKQDAKAVLAELVAVIDAAGLINLSAGVQLGPTVWYVKAYDALEAARAALASEPFAAEVLPRPGSPEASAMMDSVLAEYNYPANPKNCARAGYVAAMRLLSAPPAAEVRALIEECRAALAEELAGWDIDPPLHHVKQAHDRCVAWLASSAPATPQAAWWKQKCAHCFRPLDEPEFCEACDGEPAPQAAPAEPAQADGGEQAPPNSLPDWNECAMRVDNSDFIAKRVAEGGYGPEHDSKTATELHRFIYEYDDADPYRSAWFMHRLEKLIASLAAGAGV